MKQEVKRCITVWYSHYFNTIYKHINIQQKLFDSLIILFWMGSFFFFLNRISVFIFHICYISKVHRRDIKKGFTLKCTTVHGLNLPNCVFLPEVKVIWKLIKNGQKIYIYIKKRSCYHVQYLQIHSCIKRKKKK